MSRKDTHDQIADIFADSGADVNALTQLRDRIDEVQGQVLDEGPGDIVIATSKSFDVTRMLVEQGVLSTRHRSAGDPVDQAKLRSIVEANLAYLQATVSAFAQTPR